MHEEIIFHGSLVQYWGVIVAIWESAIGGDKFGIEPFEIPKTYRADRLPDNVARVQIWWEQAGIEIGSVIAITRPDSTVNLIVNISDDAEDAQLKWLGVKNKLQTDGWIDDQNPARKTLDYFRPAGYEIQADNTGGTAIYRRDQLGNISEAKFAPNPGWIFEVGPKSIALKPEPVPITQETRTQLPAGTDGTKQDRDTVIGHRGRKSEYSQDERDEAVKGWLRKGSDDARTLEVYLIDLFGEKDESSFEALPIVSRSRFYSWRTDYLKRQQMKK